MNPPVYIQLPPGCGMPALPFEGPFLAMVVVEADVGAHWRNEVAEWLVRSGCLYMSAWGMECSAWDDAVDWANIEEFDFEEIPDDRSVMTTWHERESLQSFFGFCRHSARHPDVALAHSLILHIARHENGAALGALFDAS